MHGLSPPLSTAPWQVPRLGMATPFRGRTLQEVTKEVVSIAKGGLERRGMDEVRSYASGGRGEELPAGTGGERALRYGKAVMGCRF